MSASPRPIRSMTGFARVRKTVPDGELLVSLKSVNHRGLDIRFHTSAELEPFENAMRTLLGKRLFRGHVDVRVALARTAGSDSLGLNRPLLAAYLTAFRKASEEAGIEAEPDLDAALRVPGMLAEPLALELGEEVRQALLSTLDEAVDTLNGFREREGGELAVDVRSRIESIGASARRVEEIRSRALPLYHARLNERLAELLDKAAIDPQRLAQETALLADRSDIGEELARLKIHASQLEEMLDAGGELGKRMDFLLQEMQRETNTILSKTSGIGELGLEITELALAAKADIEKIREQTMNLE